MDFERIDKEYHRVSDQLNALECNEEGCEYCYNQYKCTELIRRKVKLLQMMETYYADL